jgi:hypothetical protein
VGRSDTAGYAAVLRSLTEEPGLKGVFFYVSSGPGFRIDRYEAAASRLGLDKMRHEKTVVGDLVSAESAIGWDRKAEGGNEAFVLTATARAPSDTDPWIAGGAAVHALINETYRSVVGAAIGGAAGWISSVITNRASEGSKSVCQRIHDLLNPHHTPTAVALVEIRRTHLLPTLRVSAKLSRWD